MKLQRIIKHTFRLTLEEEEILNSKVEASALDTSTFIRSALKNANVFAIMTHEERSNYLVLVGLSRNLNQLARHANGSLELDSILSNLIKTLQGIDLLIEKLSKK